MDRLEITNKLICYFDEGKEKLLEGKVSFKNKISYKEDKKITKISQGWLTFDPELTSVEQNSSLPILYDYLMTYTPVTRRGYTFKHDDVTFSLYQFDKGINLFIQEEKDWGSGECLTVVDHSKINLSELEEMIDLFPKVSKFVMGNLMERKDYEKHTVLRRYFLE